MRLKIPVLSSSDILPVSQEAMALCGCECTGDVSDFVNQDTYLINAIGFKVSKRNGIMHLQRNMLMKKGLKM